MANRMEVAVLGNSLEAKCPVSPSQTGGMPGSLSRQEETFITMTFPKIFVFCAKKIPAGLTWTQVQNILLKE